MNRTLVLPSDHAAIHCWIGSCSPTARAHEMGWSVDYLHVGLATEVEEWCDAFLTRRPAVDPSRYPNATYPDHRHITSPYSDMVPGRRVSLYFATDADLFHFKLRWY